MPSQAYFVDSDGVGDWYQAIATTNPGESPATNPEKWSRLSIGDYFERFLVERTVAMLLGSDGQVDKQGAGRRSAMSTLDDTIFDHWTRRGDAYRAEVTSR